MVASDLQPDQRPERWDDHVWVYETVFEPFTLQLAEAAFDGLRLAPGAEVLDVAAGAGGAAIQLARSGFSVTAIDASARMVARIGERARSEEAAVEPRIMDGEALTFADATFDAAYSIFGIILFPDPIRGLCEMRRVVKRGGMVSVAAWTQPEAYELSHELRAAALEVWPDMPQAALPAQLRFRFEPDFRALFAGAGFGEPEVKVVTATLTASSARWLAENVAFAPGMSALLANLGERRAAALARFAERLERSRGCGDITLSGKAFIGTAQVPGGFHYRESHFTPVTNE